MSMKQWCSDVTIFPRTTQAKRTRPAATAEQWSSTHSPSPAGAGCWRQRMFVVFGEPRLSECVSTPPSLLATAKALNSNFPPPPRSAIKDLKSKSSRLEFRVHFDLPERPGLLAAGVCMVARQWSLSHLPSPAGAGCWRPRMVGVFPEPRLSEYFPVHTDETSRIKMK